MLYLVMTIFSTERRSNNNGTYSQEKNDKIKYRIRRNIPKTTLGNTISLIQTQIMNMTFSSIPCKVLKLGQQI